MCCFCFTWQFHHVLPFRSLTSVFISALFLSILTFILLCVILPLCFFETAEPEKSALSQVTAEMRCTNMSCWLKKQTLKFDFYWGFIQFQECEECLFYSLSGVVNPISFRACTITGWRIAAANKLISQTKPVLGEVRCDGLLIRRRCGYQTAAHSKALQQIPFFHSRNTLVAINH